MRRSNPMSTFANPYVILADVMVSLSFILALFLLVRTVDFELIQRIAERNQRRRAMATQFQNQLQQAQILPAKLKRKQLSGNKYALVIGNKTILEVQDDGIFAQRFRLPSGTLAFKKDSAQFASPQTAGRALDAIAHVLVANRSQIKSLTIEGYAAPGEKNPWSISQLRAELIRHIWTQDGYTADVLTSYNTPVFQWMQAEKLWQKKPFNQWHLQEYSAARVKNRQHPNGVLPLAWIAASGRGDSVERAWKPEKHGAVVEFKIEYVERSAPPIDKFLAVLPKELRAKAERKNLIASEALQSAKKAEARLKSR